LNDVLVSDHRNIFSGLSHYSWWWVQCIARAPRALYFCSLTRQGTKQNIKDREKLSYTSLN